MLMNVRQRMEVVVKYAPTSQDHLNAVATKDIEKLILNALVRK